MAAILSLPQCVKRCVTLKLKYAIFKEVSKDQGETLVLEKVWPQAADVLLPETKMNQSNDAGVITPRWVNTLRATQNGRLFTGDIFKCIFLNENV